MNIFKRKRPTDIYDRIDKFLYQNWNQPEGKKVKKYTLPEVSKLLAEFSWELTRPFIKINVRAFQFILGFTVEVVLVIIVLKLLNYLP